MTSRQSERKAGYSGGRYHPYSTHGGQGGSGERHGAGGGGHRGGGGGRGGGGRGPYPVKQEMVMCKRTVPVSLYGNNPESKCSLVIPFPPWSQWNPKTWPFITSEFEYQTGMECWTVYILSFLYLGLPLDPIDPFRYQTDHEGFSRKVQQCGTHLYSFRFGRLAIHEVVLARRDDDGVLERQIHRSSPIVAVYPNIRLTVDQQNHHNNKYDLLLGMLFETPPAQADYASGVRYFHKDWFPRAINPTTGNRYPYYLEAGGVHELTEDRLLHGYPPAEYRFAIYVCAGAKLVVFDNYHRNGPTDSHHRTLIQPGGVVIISARLRFRIPYMGQGAQPFAMSLTEGPYLTRPANQPNLTNPVVFIAASDSKYESIAWKLFIRGGYTGVNGTRDCYLEPPEGGRLAAVESWASGILEIRARHQYEQLHKASVCVTSPADNPTVDQLLNATPFQVPAPGIIANKILCQTPDGEYLDREVCVNFPDEAKPFEVPLQRQFVPYSYKYNTGAQNQATLPFVPPIWPPTVVKGQWNDVLMRMEYLYEMWYYKEPQYHRNEWDNTWGKYKRGDYYSYGLSAGYEEFPFYQVTKRAERLGFNGITNYIGLDGWLYEYVLDDNEKRIEVGTYTTKYYEPSEWVGNEFPRF